MSQPGIGFKQQTQAAHSSSQSKATTRFVRALSPQPAWLFSQKHFHFKLFSGTAAGVIVIVFLAGVFLYVTLRNHYQEALRAHTIEVMRLSSLIENDIATLESAHRGYLLTGKAFTSPLSIANKELIQHRLEDLTALILDRPEATQAGGQSAGSQSRMARTQVALPEIKSRDGQKREQPKPQTIARVPSRSQPGNSLLNQAREILQSLQDEEQIVLNQRMLEQEWATQSTQILDFLPKLERTVVEMEKEKRGYLLTGEPVLPRLTNARSPISTPTTATCRSWWRTPLRKLNCWPRSAPTWSVGLTIPPMPEMEAKRAAMRRTELVLAGRTANR